MVGEVIAYDHETGLGMVRAVDTFDVVPLPLGSAYTLGAGESVVGSGYGGFEQAIAAEVVMRQEFAGPWEYVLDNAIYTTPLHPYWGGAVLIGADGALAGVGSLYLEEPVGNDGDTRPGNMFVPIDEVLPIFGELVSTGRAQRSPRP